MRERMGSMWMSRQGGAPTHADRTADGTARHRPRSRHGFSAEQESVIELQRLAGNAAVTRALAEGREGGRVTSIDMMTIVREAMAPEKGIKETREHAGGASVVALTQRGIRDEPPLMRPEPAAKVQGGYAAKAQKVGSIPEPEIHEWWPKDGRHKVSDDTYLDVNGDWTKKLEQGEDEHRDDAKLAWELTWKKVQDTINSFAEKPGPTAETPDAAEKALWSKYVAALPEKLKPEGASPSIAKQREVLGVTPGTYFTWMWEATVSRDSRMYHETRTVPSLKATNVPPGANINEIKPTSDFKVPGPTPEDHLKEFRGMYTPGRINVASKLK